MFVDASALTAMLIDERDARDRWRSTPMIVTANPVIPPR
jgi:uncharacterized protein with PIN domain